MMQRDGMTVSERETRFGVQPRLVPAPVASPGIRDALRGAFACEKGSTAELDRLLAKLR